MATRLVYAGMSPEKIMLVESDSPAEIFAAVAKCQSKQAYMLTWLSQYEALRQYADRGQA